MRAETEEETQKKHDNQRAREKKRRQQRDKQKVALAECSTYRKVRGGEGEIRGGESAGAGVEGTPVLAELIAMMDWSNSPEHGALAPAITQRDDFANLHVRQL